MRYLIVMIAMLTFSGAKTQPDLICWQGVKCLKVEDFQGMDKSDSIASAIGMVPKPGALSTIEVKVRSVSYDSINKYRFVGYFNKNLSWIDKEGNLLSHEQTHFNIQELILRRANKRLDSIYRYTGEKVNYDSLMDVLSNEMDNMGNEFDLMTSHGAVVEYNEKWVERIASEVETLDQYGVSCESKTGSGSTH